MTDPTPSGPLPAAPYIKIADDGRAHLAFPKCDACGAMFLEGDRLACARCGAVGAFSLQRTGSEGTLHSYSIVHRGFPGVTVPFISAVVDVDDGPALKGNLRGLPFDPAAIRSGMRVRIVFDDALDRKDSDGNSYISHFFEPAQDA